LAERVPARLTAREGRRFAFPVGLAFLALAGVLWWRDHLLAAGVLAGIGSTLLLGGLVLPSRLGPVYRAWMGLAHAISKVTTPIFMGVVYYGAIAPMGLLRRTFGSNPVRHIDEGGTYWKSRSGEGRRSDLTRQF
jgi:hypothetical protein